jgi:hypothetical protein
MKGRRCFLFADKVTMLGPAPYSVDIEVACICNHPHQIPLSCVSTQTIYRTCLLYMQFSAAYTCYRRWHRFYGYIMKAGNWASTHCLVRIWERINSIKSACNGSNTTHHPVIWLGCEWEKPTANRLTMKRLNFLQISCTVSEAVWHE